MIKPQIKVERLEVEDPTFEGGTSHSATARLTNPTAMEFTYTTELYLGVLKAATSGVSAPFSIPAGGSTDVVFTLVAPAIAGVHEVYLDVWSNSTLIAHYRGTEDVVVAVTPQIVVGPIIWT